MRTIREWPKEEPPRERLWKHEPEALSDVQLLAVILRARFDQEDVRQLSIRPLKGFDSLSRYPQASSSAEGSVTSTVLRSREVFQPAVCASTVSRVFLHNHPSDDSRLSNEGGKIERRLRSTGKLMGILILNHIIFGDKSYFSLAGAVDIKKHETAMSVSENSPPLDIKGE